MISATSIMLLISATIFLGYLGSIFYRKTRIPDFIWLLLFGIILGPITHLYDSGIFIELSPIMSIIALSIILFEAGINTDISLIAAALPKALLMIAFTFTLIVISVGFFLYLFMPGSFTLLQGLLLGTMVGGTSTVTTLSIVGALESMVDVSNVKTTLMLESVLTDPICIVAAITLIRMIMLPGVSIKDGLESIFFSFGISSIIGLILGLIWAVILDKLSDKRYNYMVTLAVLFLAYILSEEIGGYGAGPLAALLFGLILSNIDDLLRLFHSKRIILIDTVDLKRFHEEITFFIRSFFFVFVGLIVSISAEILIVGLILTGICLVMRYFAVSFAARIMKFSRMERDLYRFIFAQGLPALIMSRLPAIFDPGRKFFPAPDIYTNLCFVIVLGTVLYGAILSQYVVRKKLVTSNS